MRLILSTQSLTFLDMRSRNTHIVGLVRPLPRMAEATQRRSLEEIGAEQVFNLADEDDAAALDRIRIGDTVAVYELHLLASRSVRSTHPHTLLFWWLRHLVDRRVALIEARTGRRVDLAEAGDIPALLDMLLPAVRTISVGVRGRAVVATARTNGAKSGGAPQFDPSKNRSLVEAVHYAPRDKRLKGKAFIKALRRLGWSRAYAYKHLGSRDGK